jgi:starch synthase
VMAPLLVVISRLSDQKGLDLVLQAVDRLVALGANIAVLGKGEAYYHSAFAAKAKQHSGNVRVTIGFEEQLAHRLYAAADFFLMPSRYEPCGIGQLIAMRYGAVPVARRTGGLADTIVDYDHLREEGTGFLFQDFTPASLMDGVKRAFCVYTRPAAMKRLVLSGMEKDVSWKSSARQYLGLYRKAKQKAVS